MEILSEYSWLGWIIIGLLAGGLAKLIMPGKDPGGCIVTILLGIVGAVVGGVLAGALGIGVSGGLGTFIAAVVGAIILLFIYRLVAKRR